MSCLHRGPYIQRGRGLGGTLSSMFKGVVPAMQVMGKKILAEPETKNVLKTLKRSAVEAGLNVASDTLSGKKLKESLSENVTTAKKAIKKSLSSALKARASRVGNKTDENVVGVQHGGMVKVSKRKKNLYGDIFEEKF